MKNLVRFDWAVMRLLRNKANYDILEGFLSELLVEDVKIEQLLESEGNKQTADDKTNRVDLLVQNDKGELIIIEVQNDYKQDYLMRMLYGTSKIVTDHMSEGMDYSAIKKVISVNIVYFDLGRGEDYVYHGTTQYIGIHKKDILRLSPSEEGVYHTTDIAALYPEYYIIKVNNFNEVSPNTLDEWINFLKTEEVKEDSHAKGLKKAATELDVMKLSKEDRLQYENYIKDWRDNYSTIVGHYNKGKHEGKVLGKEEGRNERNKEIVISLHKRGMSPVEISEITNLSVVEIEKIISENN